MENGYDHKQGIARCIKIYEQKTRDLKLNNKHQLQYLLLETAVMSLNLQHKWNKTSS